MIIRKTEMKDLPAVMEIYAYARSFMAEHGNPRQWGPTNWPPRELIENDIQLGNSYVCEDEGQIAAVFYYICGMDIEPTYRCIEEGAWQAEGPYGVVHRIASAPDTKGAGSYCILWAFEQSRHLRIDTHPDNRVMQSLLKKLGFSYCGIIHVEEDDDPRLAFEKWE